MGESMGQRESMNNLCTTEGDFMKFLTPAILAATLALSTTPVFATDPPADSAASATQSMSDCMATQEAKNTGASKADMEKACAQETESTYSASQSRSIDSHPYGAAPAPDSETSPQSESPPPR